MLVNNDAFLIKEIPNYNPITQRAERIAWWKEQKRYCMEGYWAGNKWCPGELYHYVNFWTIAVGKKDGKKGKIAGRPWFRDIEWEKALIATEAFGFSGFEKSDEIGVTCYYKYAPENVKAYLESGDITEENVRKLKYITPRDFLNMNYPRPLGKPLYENPAKNVIDIEARGGGKSYWGSNLIQHHFGFDGLHDYNEYLKLRELNQPAKSETLVGAIQAKYSADLLSKWKFGFERYPGKFTMYTQDYDEPLVYPSPLSINVKGSVALSNDSLMALHSGSLLHHRTFQDDPFAANGTRPYRVFLEEIGFFYRLIETLGHMRDLTYDGEMKQGTIWMFGTGGDMEGGSTLAAQEVFYNPEAYDCLVFEDEWEGRGKIGYFMPAEKALNGFKEGPNYITNMEKAAEYLENDRKKAKKANTAKPYQDMLQNRPRKPSEAFLAINENKFPISHLEDAFVKLTSKESELASHWTGFIRMAEDDNGNTYLKFHHSENIPLRQWPQPKNVPTEGCVEIFEMPRRDSNNQPMPNRYLASTDPVDDDDVEGSLQSTFIYDMFTNRIVAEYTARTYQVEDYWENTRLLLMYYDALCNYEANKKGFYGYMKNKSSLHLLADTPTILRDLDLAVIKDEGNKSKGTIASKSVNEYGRKLYNIWLKKTATGKDNLTNAQTLRSLGLINESLQYNPKGNFDRISAIEKLFIIVADKEQQMGGSQEDINEAMAGLAADPFFNKNYDRWIRKNRRGNFTKINNELKSA